jgi:hypothetical protein
LSYLPFLIGYLHKKNEVCWMVEIFLGIPAQAGIQFGIPYCNAAVIEF